MIGAVIAHAQRRLLELKRWLKVKCAIKYGGNYLLIHYRLKYLCSSLIRSVVFLLFHCSFVSFSLLLIFQVFFLNCPPLVTLSIVSNFPLISQLLVSSHSITFHFPNLCIHTSFFCVHFSCSICLFLFVSVFLCASVFFSFLSWLFFFSHFLSLALKHSPRLDQYYHYILFIKTRNDDFFFVGTMLSSCKF